MSDDLAALRDHISDLENRLREHQAAVIEASRHRHDYLVENAFGMARLVMLVFGLIGSAALSILAYYVAPALVDSRFAVIIAMGTFFLLFWLTQRGTRQLFRQQAQRDRETFPAWPEWEARIDG